MSQFRCFGGRKTVIIDGRFVLVIPQLVIVFDFYYYFLSFQVSRMHMVWAFPVGEFRGPWQRGLQEVS